MYPLCADYPVGAPTYTIATPSLLHSALANSHQDKDLLASRLSFQFLGEAVDPFNNSSVTNLDFINLNYKVEWPLNIIIDQSALSIYSKVFFFLSPRLF